MQTFVTRPSIATSVLDLDDKRLGKQRVETLQIYSALTGVKMVDDVPTIFTPKGWINHPAVKMWRGHEDWLFFYQDQTCTEWVSRGFKDTCLDKTRRLHAYATRYGLAAADSSLPTWIGDPLYYMSHQANLLRKDFDFYSQVFDVGDKTVADFADVDYVWPVS